MLKEEYKMSGWKITIILITVLVLALVFISMRGVNKLSEIRSYDLIVINNTEYPTSEIENISFPYYGYESQTITIILKDGTVIYTDDYILKNK
jgi:hypothetical protein